MELELLPQGARDIVMALGVSDAITVLSTLAGTKWPFLAPSAKIIATANS